MKYFLSFLDFKYNNCSQYVFAVVNNSNKSLKIFYLNALKEIDNLKLFTFQENSVTDLRYRNSHIPLKPFIKTKKKKEKAKYIFSRIFFSKMHVWKYFLENFFYSLSENIASRFINSQPKI